MQGCGEVNKGQTSVAGLIGQAAGPFLSFNETCSSHTAPQFILAAAMSHVICQMLGQEEDEEEANININLCLITKLQGLVKVKMPSHMLV